MAGDRAITQDLMDRLERHYIKPGQNPAGGIFLPEVGWNATGGTGRCDALYVGFTSTSGRMLVGHEVKASRADWLNELKKPGKADGWGDHCHEWWLVTVPGVVQDGELPPGWGLMVPGPSRTRMKVVTRADRHLDRSPSWDAARSIMARLDTLQGDVRDRIRDEERARVAAELDKHDDNITQIREMYDRRVEDQKRLIDRIEQALGGVHIVSWDGDRGVPSGSQITVGELADLSALLAHHRNLREAAASLAGRYALNLGPLRKAAKELESAFTRARDGLPATARTERW